jgi:hypothetical protein
MKYDRIIGALISLVNACSSRQKTPNTDRLIIKSLAFPLLRPNCLDEEIDSVVAEIREEIKEIAHTDAALFDMDSIYKADGDIREFKLMIIAKLEKIAEYACKHRVSIDSNFFYRALSHISCDTEKIRLLELLEETEKIEWSIRK